MELLPDAGEVTYTRLPMVVCSFADVLFLKCWENNYDGNSTHIIIYKYLKMEKHPVLFPKCSALMSASLLCFLLHHSHRYHMCVIKPVWRTTNNTQLGGDWRHTERQETNKLVYDLKTCGK